MSDTIMIARTAERESYSDDGVYWWTEYRVRKDLDWWVLENRYVCRLPDGRVAAKFPQGELAAAMANPTDPAQSWTQWNVAKTVHTVIDDMLGDTAFFEAESLCPTHAFLVSRLWKLRELVKAETHALETLRAAQEALDDFKRKEQRKFDRTHGDKSGEAHKKARERTVKRLQPRYDSLVSAVCRCTDALRTATEARKKQEATNNEV